MATITKKYIFECRLKAEPIVIHSDHISDEEIQLLLDHKVLSSTNGEKDSNHLVGRAVDQMVSMHCIQSNAGPDFEAHDIFPGRLVTLRHRTKR